MIDRFYKNVLIIIGSPYFYVPGPPYEDRKPYRLTRKNFEGETKVKVGPFNR